MHFAEVHGQDHHWRVPGVAQANLDRQLAPKQPTRLPAKTMSARQTSRRRPKSVATRPTRRPTNQADSRDNSQERAEHRAAERAARKAAQAEALEREWRVQQVAGELGRQADLLERHRYLVAKYGTSDAADRFDQPASPSNQVSSLDLLQQTGLSAAAAQSLLKPSAAGCCKLPFVCVWPLLVSCNCFAASGMNAVSSACPPFFCDIIVCGVADVQETCCVFYNGFGPLCRACLCWQGSLYAMHCIM